MQSRGRLCDVDAVIESNELQQGNDRPGAQDITGRDQVWHLGQRYPPQLSGLLSIRGF